MNSHPQPFAGQGRAPPPNGHGHNPRQSSARLSGDFRSSSMNGGGAGGALTPNMNGHNGPMAVPPPRGPGSMGHNHNHSHNGGQNGGGGGGGNGNAGGAGQGFGGARSPPTQKNSEFIRRLHTRVDGMRKQGVKAYQLGAASHVPCKFFRQGTCQAGAACPFLHGEISQPCKYFQKGNCKFGLKCANDHIAPDGRKVNKQTGYMMPGPLNLGGRVMPPPAGPPSANSLLTMQQDQFAQPQPIPGASGHHMNPDPWRNPDASLPANDTIYNSLPQSNYGSPPAESSHLLLSPPLRGLTAAQAQLPASFDSQGISQYARDGPFAASVPSRFGFDQPSPPARPIESSALRNLHSSAFGDENNSTNGKLIGGGLPSSPPTMTLGDDGLMGRRILHSERFSSGRNNNRMLSASVGARPPMHNMHMNMLSSNATAEEWDDLDPTFALEEEMVPGSLHDLLTPQEKARRFSRSAEDEMGTSNANRPSLPISGLGTPAEASSKVGSPSQHASPSRFGAFFAGRAREGSDSSPFGPVGSPLRNAGLHPNASPSLRAAANARPLSGELGPGLSSPPRQASMSMISQQLQRTRLSERVSESASSSNLSLPIQHPGISRVASGSSSAVASSSPPTSSGGRLTVDRAVSSSSVGRDRDKIDEEPEELFSMDEISSGAGRLDEMSGGIGGGGGKENVWKRSSGGGGGGSAWAQGNPFSLGKASPRVGAIGGHRETIAKGAMAGRASGEGL